MSSLSFSISSHTTSNRLQRVDLTQTVIDQFERQTRDWSIQALEYKPFLRFAIADKLDELCDRQLAKNLKNILLTRETGAFLLDYQGPRLDADLHVRLSTAVSHLIGLPNFDAMSRKYYARFIVRNQDQSDSYLRQAHRRMELHNDGTYVNEQTDFVIMMKMAEQSMQGGNSLLLHLDDWQQLEFFYQHPQAIEPIQWQAPPSKNVKETAVHPVFFTEPFDNRPRMQFIDQFANPENMQQGLYLYQIGKSLETESNTLSVRLPVGAMLVLENHVWLHGRDQFVPHPDLERELLRQRGHFVD